MKKILIFLFLISVTLALRAQNGYWEEAKGPYGGGGFQITKTNSGRLYACANPKQTYRSDDNGFSWDRLLPLGESFPDSLQKSLAIGNSGTFFIQICDSNCGIWRCYKSNDEGQSWVALDSLIKDIFETQNGTLLCHQWGGNKIWRSTDGGQNWFVSLNTAGYTQITPYGEIVNYSDQTIYRSQDDGLTWSSQTITESFDLAPYITPSGTVFGVNASEKKIYRSTDGGATFSTSFQLPVFSAPTFAVLNSGRILLQIDGNTNGLYYSDDEGISWSSFTDNVRNPGGVLVQIATLPDGTIFKEHLEALVRSSDGGVTWQFSGTGIRSATVSEMKFVTDSLYYVQNRIGLWRTDNAGETWNLLVQNQNEYGFKERNFAINSTGGVAVFQDDKLLWSSDFGETFADITPTVGVLYFQNVFLNPLDNTLFVNSNWFQKSSNFGQTWTFSAAEIASGMIFHPSGRIIVNGQDNLLISDNGGNTWSNIPHPSEWDDAGTVASIAPNGTIYFSSENNLLWQSTDLGETWTKLPLQEVTSMAIASNGHLYVSDGYQDFLLSVDEGHTWQTLPEKFFTSAIYNIALSPSQRLFAGVHGQFEAFYGLRLGLYKSSSPVTQGAYIEGHVRVDADADCSTPDAQAPLKNRIIEAEGESFNYFTNTDPDGHYIFFVDTGAYQVSVQNPNSIWWDYCEDSIAVNLTEFFVTDTADFAAVPLTFCPLMTVNVAIPNLRRCFDNTVYVEYCNQGTEPADSAWVDVMLDPYLSFVNSAQPHEAQPNNTIRFFVGNIPSGDCGQFQLTVHVDCDSTVVGQTHCVTAHGFPDTLCTALPSWSGANIEASVVCQDTTVQFHLKNTGSSPSQILDFIIIEDDIVLLSGQESYDIGEDLILDVLANGSTWRIESEQEPGHPFSTLALAFTEGCGGFSSLGYVNQFTVNGITPSWHRMCVENIGSFDPNDKQGFPKGTGSEHNIRPGQTIDYLIRFQNTGTDTAFTVVVKDTLSSFLDPLSIRTGASSHAYTWDLSGEGVITFRFNNILLPDSNINEAGSHGFVQFSIAPHAITPLGSVIENDAAIYFDFNEPVITNTTWHTLEKSPLISAIRPEPQITKASLDIWPNPFNERTNIHVDQKTTGTLVAQIYNSQGALVAQKTAVGPDIELSGKHLPAGLYWIEVRNTKAEIVGKGKVLRQ